ncbi:MAG: class I SAM-dependent methyltransferase [Flavobacteriales bacterium]|nr:class I SAM-dependent methyltransferase [Flavobacteriales bacterium]
MEHTPLEALTTCPICGENELVPSLAVEDRSVSNETFHLTDCARCGFRFTNPRPIQANIGRYYQSADYISHTNAAASLQDRIYQLARKWALGSKHRLIRRYQPNGRVLDVGCGTGEFLAYLKSRGYLVHGVEPSIKAREQAIANHAVEVVPSLEMVAHQERFKVVTLWHVLEHLPDPRTTLKNLFALIADRGLLVIAVPDRGSWDAQHYGPDWAAWDVPRHLSHFQQMDIKRLLHEHGFELVTIKRMWLDAAYVSMLTEKHRGTGATVALFKGVLVGLWSNVVSALTGRPSSSSLYLAQKAKP